MTAIKIKRIVLTGMMVFSMVWLAGCGGGNSDDNSDTKKPHNNSMPGTPETIPVTKSIFPRVPLGTINISPETPEGEWLKISKTPNGTEYPMIDDLPFRWCYQAGKRLVFTQEGPKVFLSIDEKSFSLVGLIIRSKTEMAMVDQLPERQAKKLTLWIYAPCLKHLAGIQNPERIGSIYIWNPSLGPQRLRTIDLSPVARCKNIQSLSVTDFLDLTDLGPLKGLSKLTSLSIRSTDISDFAPLKDCPLRWLDIQFTSVTPESSVALAHLKSLRCLYAFTFFALVDKKEAWKEILPELVELEYLIFQVFDESLSAIGTSSSLKSLTLQGCINEFDFSGLSAFPNLENLKIHGDLNGSDLTPLAQLKKLQALEIEATQSQPRKPLDLTPVGDVTLLQRVSITSVSSLLGEECIGKLPYLKHVSLRTDSLAKTPFFKNPEKIITADFSQINDKNPLGKKRKLIDISSLNKLINLKELNLQGCENLKDYGSLAGLKNLRVLKLGGTSGKSLQPLARLIKLEVLGLRNMSTNDLSPLKDMVNLQELDLSNDHYLYANVKNMFVLDDIATLPKLRKLDLINSKAVGIEKLNLPALQVLRMPANSMPKGFLHIIRRHPNLEKLDVNIDRKFYNRDQPTPEYKEAISKLSSLKQLNWLEIRLPKELAPLSQLTQLTHLRVGCQTADFSQIQSLSALRFFSGGCRFSGGPGGRCPLPTHIEALKHFPNLLFLSWDDIPEKKLSPLIDRGVRIKN